MEQQAPLEEDIIRALATASTGMLNDALALAGIEGSVVGIRPARGFEDTRIAGRASTMFLAPPHPDTPPLNMYAALRGMTPGNIVVIDGGGYDANFTGDNQGEWAKRTGMVGIVVNGGARDVAGYRAIGMPLFHMGAATRVGKVQLTAVDVPVRIGGVLIRPSDVIVADEDGVVAIPASLVELVLKNLKVIAEVETSMEAAIHRDAPWQEIASIIAKKKQKAVK